MWPLAGTVTEAGTMNTIQSGVLKVTTAPPVGAAEVRVTVPVALLPNITTAGLKLTENSDAGGLTVRTAAFAAPL